MLDGVFLVLGQEVLLFALDLDDSPGEMGIGVVLARVCEASSIHSKFNFLEVIAWDAMPVINKFLNLEVRIHILT